MSDAAASLFAASKGRLLAAEDFGHSAKPGTVQGKARAASQDFESVFLQTMIGEMLSGLGKEGPLGQGEAGGAWRGMLVQEFAGTIAKAGGVGIADSVYRDILAMQEKHQAAPTRAQSTSQKGSS